MRKQTRVAIGVLMVVIGGLWIVQGLGWLSGSEMSGHPVWVVIGGAVALGGVVVAVRAARGEDSVPMWAIDPRHEADSAPGTWSAQQPDPPSHPPGAGDGPTT